MVFLHKYHYPVENTTTLLYFIHGYGDHAGRYLDFAKYLNRHGISFYAHDLRGLGQSGPVNGMMAHVEKFDDYVDEVIDEIHMIQKNNKKYKKLIVLGHSMGGLVAMRVALRIFPDGLILSAPLLQFNEMAAPLLVLLLPYLARCAPNLYMPYDFCQPEWLSQDLDVQKATANDPHMRHRGARFGNALDIYQTISTTKALWNDLDTKTHIFHGPGDMLCDIQGSRALHKLKPDIVTLHEIEDAAHGLLLEIHPIRERVYTEILDAIKSFST